MIKDTFVLLKLAMLAEYIFIGGTVAGLLYLRRSKPDMPRPIKVIHVISHKIYTYRL